MALRKHIELLRRIGQRDIELVAGDELQPDPARDQEVLRIAQEALQNAVKHAHAHRIAARLQGSDGILLEVVDDGVGFDPGADGIRSRRLGLTSMEERAERIGGSISIESTPGEGTTVRLEVPGG